ncbi:MAG: Na+/H+ antiporter subunit C [Bryobacteraceae bacterium]|nr:Na+/H+ antiporter subunit C [Bryobacteraceae bacterium]
MTLVLALTIGLLYGAAMYMIIRRSIVKLVFGLVLLSHAANLLIFTVGGLTRDHPPLAPEQAALPHPPAVADPLPQALILTAIVISFGVLAFVLALVRRTVASAGTDDLDDLRTTEQ